MKRIIPFLLVFTSCSQFHLPTKDTWIETACNVYNQGYTYVDTIVLPNLDGMTGLAARLALEAANGQIVRYCELHSNGAKVSRDDIAPSLAKGSRALAELIEIGDSQPSKVNTLMGKSEPEPVVATVDTAKLVRALRNIEAKATKEMSH